MTENQVYCDSYRCVSNQEFSEQEYLHFEHIQRQIDKGKTPLVVFDNHGNYPVGCIIGIDDPCQETVIVSMPSCYEYEGGVTVCSLDALRKYSKSDS